MGKRDLITAKGFYFVTFLFILFMLHPLSMFGQEVNPPKPNKVEVRDNFINVDVRDADVSDVLREIEKGTGIKIKIANELIGKKVTANFENLDAESALRTILNNSDSYYVLNFSQDPTNKEKHILKEVKVNGDIIGAKPYRGRMISKDITYGSGNGEVGAVSEGEGAIIGPKSFTVDDEGNIYICDTVNERVQVFSSNGDYLSTIPLKVEGMATDIAIDKRGFIYIYDRIKLYQYDKKGNFIKAVDVDEGRWGGGGTMHIINNEIYMYACDSKTCGDFTIGRTLFNNLLVGPSDKESKRFKEKGKQGFSGKKYMTGLRRFERGEMEIKAKDSGTSQNMSFPLREILSIKFLGEDKKGNVYVKTERNKAKVIVVDVHKFSMNYDYLNTITMPESDVFFVPNKEYFVDKDGTIYRLLPKDDKLRLEMFLSESN